MTTPSVGSEVTDSVIVNTATNATLLLGDAYLDGEIGSTAIP